MVALKRVLCPVDLSELSIRALACAGIAEWYLSELIVLRLVRWGRRPSKSCVRLPVPY